MNARISSGSDGSTVEEQQLHNNLILLGLSGIGCKTVPAGAELNRFTFRKPSSRTLEHVLYHLYATVVGESVAQKEFKNFYPVTDASQGKEFNQRISDWLKSLKERGNLEMNSISTASQLRSASGFRLVSTLLDLSCVALYSNLQRCDPELTSTYVYKAHSSKEPKQQQLVSDLGEAMKAVALMDVQTQAQEFAAICEEAAAAQRQEEGAVAHFRDLYYSLKAEHQKLSEGLDPANLQLLSSLGALDEGMAAADALRSLVPAATPQQLLPPLSTAGGATGGGGSSSAMATPALGASAWPRVPEPGQVMAQLGALGRRLERYRPLGEALHAVVSCAVHPNAIDGGALLEATSAAAAPAAAGAGGAGGGALPSSSSGTSAGVDVAEMLHTWAGSLEACLPHFRSLAGRQGDPRQQQGVEPGAAAADAASTMTTDFWNLPSLKATERQQKFGGPGGASEGGGPGPHPLVAPADARGSHAALLTTQLGVRRAALAGLQATVREMSERAIAADVKAKGLEPAVRKLVRDTPAHPRGGIWGGHAAEQPPQQQQLPLHLQQQQYRSGVTDPEGFGVIEVVGPVTAPAAVSGFWEQPEHAVKPFPGDGLLSGHWGQTAQVAFPVGTAVSSTAVGSTAVGSTYVGSTVVGSTVAIPPAPLSLLDDDDGGNDLWAMDVDSPSAADIMRALDCSPRTSKALGQVGSLVRGGAGAVRSSRLGLRPASGPSDVPQAADAAAGGGQRGGGGACRHHRSSPLAAGAGLACGLLLRR